MLIRTIGAEVGDTCCIQRLNSNRETANTVHGASCNNYCSKLYGIDGSPCRITSTLMRRRPSAAKHAARIAGYSGVYKRKWQMIRSRKRLKANGRYDRAFQRKEEAPPVCHCFFTGVTKADVAASAVHFWGGSRIFVAARRKLWQYSGNLRLKRRKRKAGAPSGLFNRSTMHGTLASLPPQCIFGGSRVFATALDEKVRKGRHLPRTRPRRETR